ncbi:TPA: GNAT family N-acetyltransferase [Pseudomonas aeruginosa]|uniref:GNAT family N-acetyltransferase n=2 Tax=Pseudomonas TaxID=286 RepID=A0ABD7K658_PSEAI|nr:GNAT family N-acetyltransferase [Pseudomonas paraeruginosa]RTS48367.1 GNAT family N-acetyltransferase [Pseudomonas aeruginosa]HBP6462458.1 GNAT family N-acetyltransferase [Pseudomonas aeruginosa]HBP6819399.1 GNAT family N-acetyltransferase [Pseudomonas aeruginosa]
MLYPIELPGHAGRGERCTASGRHVNGRESVCHATATKVAHNFPQPRRCSMNPNAAIPAAQDPPNAPQRTRIPDSPFARFDVRIASEHDAPRLSLLLQQLGSADPGPDPALLAVQLQRPRSDRVTLVAERGERLLGTCTLHLIEHLAHDFARSAILEDMVVDHHARGQGVGRELIGRAVERARSWGCYKLALSSHQDRETAQRFYAALGFTSHGVGLALHLD